VRTITGESNKWSPSLNSGDHRPGYTRKEMTAGYAMVLVALALLVATLYVVFLTGHWISGLLSIHLGIYALSAQALIVLTCISLVFLIIRSARVRVRRNGLKQARIAIRNYRRFVSYVNIFPFPVHYAVGSKALDKFKALRGKVDGVAVIIGDRPALKAIASSMTANQAYATRQWLDASRKIQPLEWLTARGESDPLHSLPEPGEWPDQVLPNMALTACDDADKEIFITIVPAPEPWMVPCYLHFGGWNDCPKPDEHAALFKYWHEHYGATVATMTYDTLEFTVSSPPETREDAIILAKQHVIYCADIGLEGMGAIENYAARLLYAPVWHFWWD
jgi:hypothetical protein